MEYEFFSTMFNGYTYVVYMSMLQENVMVEIVPVKMRMIFFSLLNYTSLQRLTLIFHKVGV